MLHFRETGDEELYLFMTTRNGTVKRLEVSALKNLRNNGIRALTLDEGDELISVTETRGHDRMLIATHDGQAVCFDETDVRAMGRTAVGVRGIRLREGDYVIGAARADADKTVLSITENGYGKRTPIEDYRVTRRGGLGIRNYMVTDKTGPVVGMKVVDGTGGPAAGNGGGHPDPHTCGKYPRSGPRPQGRHRHALQGGGRPGHLAGSGRSRGEGAARVGGGPCERLRAGHHRADRDALLRRSSACRGRAALPTAPDASCSKSPSGTWMRCGGWRAFHTSGSSGSLTGRSGRAGRLRCGRPGWAATSAWACSPPVRPSGQRPRALRCGAGACGLGREPEGPVLYVRGADMVSGTPIVDIKPYLAYADSYPRRRRRLYRRRCRRGADGGLSPELLAQFDSGQRHGLLSALAADPRPGIRTTPTACTAWLTQERMRFTVQDGTVRVVGVE